MKIKAFPDAGKTNPILVRHSLPPSGFSEGGLPVTNFTYKVQMHPSQHLFTFLLPLFFKAFALKTPKVQTPRPLAL